MAIPVDLLTIITIIRAARRIPHRTISVVDMDCNCTMEGGGVAPDIIISMVSACGGQTEWDTRGEDVALILIMAAISRDRNTPPFSGEWWAHLSTSRRIDRWMDGTSNKA